MFRSILITFIFSCFIQFSYAVKNEEKTVFVNDDGTNIILTNNKDGRIVHIFVSKSSDVPSNLITLQVMGVNIKTRSIHFRDEKVESEDKYQSEILKDTFKRFRGTVDNVTYQKLKSIIGKYVQKEEMNHNISSALKFLDAQGYDLQTLLGNDDEMSCYPSHIIRTERDTVRQILPHGKCMVTQDTLTVLKSSSGSVKSNRILNIPTNYVVQNSRPITTKFKTTLDNNYYYLRDILEPTDYEYRIAGLPLYEDYENYLDFNNDPSYTWYNYDMYPTNRFDAYSYQPKLELPYSQWTEMLSNGDSLGYSQLGWD